MKKLHLAILLLVSVSIGGCPNILREFANKETDEAHLIQAQIYINESNWTAAISEFEAMSAAFRANNEVALQYASAYAGRCGFDMLGMFQDISDGITASTPFLQILFSSMQGTTATQAADCVQAESIMRGLTGYPSSLTVKENTTLAFISFSKVGGLLAANADDADLDGIIDSDFDACVVGGVGISDDDVKSIGTGITIGTRALGEATSEGGAVGGDELSELTDMCSFVTTLYPANDFCSNYDEADFTDPNHVDGVRFAVKDNVVFGTGNGGGGGCNLGLPANCSCP